MNSDDKRNTNQVPEGPKEPGSEMVLAKPGPVVAFRRVRPPQNPKSEAEIITQDDLVEYALLTLRVRHLRHDLAEAIAARHRKRHEIRAEYSTIGMRVEPGFHRIWKSSKGNLVIA